MTLTMTVACPGPLITPPIDSAPPAIVVIDDDGGAGAPGAAALCSARGTADISCVNADLVLVPPDAPTGWAAAVWPAAAAELVRCY